MYDNPLASKDASYLKSADELNAVVGRASSVLQSRKTQQFKDLDSDFESDLDDLDGKLNKLESAVKLIEDAAASAQALIDAIAAIKKIFGL
jgi:hypothetical protein